MGDWFSSTTPKVGRISPSKPQSGGEWPNRSTANYFAGTGGSCLVHRTIAAADLDARGAATTSQANETWEDLMPLQLAMRPVAGLVRHIHALLRMAAPTNRLIPRYRDGQEGACTSAGLVLAALPYVLLASVMSMCVEEGSPIWLDIAVVVLTWDCAKLVFAVLAPRRRLARSRPLSIQPAQDHKPSDP